MNSNVTRKSRLLGAGEIDVSYEFFPPKTEKMEGGAVGGDPPARAAEALVRLGDLRRRRLDARAHAQHGRAHRQGDDAGAGRAPHLRAATREEVDDVVRGYWDAGVRHIVALRGDPQTGVGTRYEPHPGRLRHAADLVAGIKRIANFEVSVGGYPEKHPESASLQTDIDNLKRKVDAGADRIITQFFFDNAHYLRFVERVRARGHLVPGRARHRADPQLQAGREFRGQDRRVDPRMACAQVRRSRTRREDVASRRRRRRRRAGAADLVDEGIRQFHFYTLNRADLVYAICHLLGPASEHLPKPAREASRLKADPMPSQAQHARPHQGPAQGRRRAHPDHRRRHGHHDPAPQAGRGSLSRRALQELAPRRQGQQRSARADAAGHDPRHPSRLYRGRRRHHRDQHVQRPGRLHGRLRHGGARPRTERRGGAARARSRRRGGEEGRPHALGRRCARPDQPHRVDLARRQQSRLPRRLVRPGPRRLCRADARPDRGRRASSS